jgi:LysM repeat protein
MENPVKTIAGGGAASLGVEGLKKLNEPDTQVPDSVQEPVKRTAPHQKGVKEEDVLTWNKSINKFESGKESAQVAEELEELALTTGVTDVMEEWQERTIPLDVENELKELGILSDTSYTIQKGDTLSEIAERHSRGVEELMEMNPQIKDADQIFAGDSLQLGTLIKSPFDAGIAGGLGDYASGTPPPTSCPKSIGCGVPDA